MRDDADVEDFVRRNLELLYHPSGTCRMGGDDAVLDPELRVRGIEGLRVIDASVFPVIPGGNTNAPTIMVAERAADLVKGRVAAPACAPERVALGGVAGRVDLAQRPVFGVEDEAADVVAMRQLAGAAEALERVVERRLEVAEGAEAPVGQDAVVGELLAEVVLGGVAEAAALVHDHDDVLGAQQALGCAEGAHGVVGDEATGVADDVGVAALEAEHREEVDARVHAGQHGDLALWAGAEPRGGQLR